MSIVARRGRIAVEPRSRPLRYGRSPSSSTAAATVDDRHELARLALEIVVRTSEPMTPPRLWSTPAFAREVDRTRAQLAPIRTPEALAASFGREASVAATRDADGAGPRTPGPVRVAYALRWLELGDDRPRAPWAAIANGLVDELAAFVRGAGQRIGERTR